MSRRTLKEEGLSAIRELAKGWGKIVVKRAFGEDGPGLDIDLDLMEQVAVAAAQGLTAGALEEATRQQATRLPDHVPCPGCGQPCPLAANPEDRTVAVRGGQFLHREPVAHCPACRRDFFPSASAVGP